jgi:hypothetical protein
MEYGIFWVNVTMEKRKYKVNRKVFFVLVFVFVFLVLQISLSTYQHSRYFVDVYDCSDMSEDCEQFFESFGFDTKLMRGESKNSGTWHEWVVIDFFGIPVYFESTLLTIASKFEYHTTYKDIDISDGYFVNGEYVEDWIWEDHNTAATWVFYEL